MTSPVWGLGLSSAGGKKETGGIFPFLVFRALQQICEASWLYISGKK